MLVVTCHSSGNGSVGLHCSSLVERGARLARWRSSSQGLQDFNGLSILHSSPFREVREMYWPSSDRESTREDDLARLKDIYGFETVCRFSCYIFATFQALLLLFPNGERQPTSGSRRYSSFHLCPHPTNLLFPFHTLHHPPEQASPLLCKNSFWVSTSKAAR